MTKYTKLVDTIEVRGGDHHWSLVIGHWSLVIGHL